jgi:hypothetical protein
VEGRDCCQAPIEPLEDLELGVFNHIVRVLVLGETIQVVQRRDPFLRLLVFGCESSGSATSIVQTRSMGRVDLLATNMQPIAISWSRPLGTGSSWSMRSKYMTATCMVDVNK